MTWTKLGTEFWDDCAEAGLSDAAVRTHAEAISYVYRQASSECRIKKSTMRRWAGSDRTETAVAELTNAGFWRDLGSHWVIVHHADVVRQSLAAQHAKLNRDRRSQRAKRARDGGDVSADVIADVSADPDRQTDRQAGSNKAKLEEDVVTRNGRAADAAASAEPEGGGPVIDAAFAMPPQWRDRDD